MVAAIDFFGIVKFLHVAAVVAAFGVTFAYPVLQRLAEQKDPRALPYFWGATGRVGFAIIFPGSLLILITGIIMVIDQEAFGFGDSWVTVGMAAIIILIALGPLFFVPVERRLSEAAHRDVEAAGAGEVALSEDYRGLSKRYARVGQLNTLIILVAIFFMVVKP